MRTDIPLQVSPAELYGATPERVIDVKWHDDLLYGCYFDHVPELNKYDVQWERNEKVSIRIVHEVDFDGRRFWRLATVWFDQRPVMVIQNAGREGDDHARRFITDMTAYGDMLGYLVSLYKSPELQETEIIDPYERRDDLTSFYGGDMHHVGRYDGY